MSKFKRILTLVMVMTTLVVGSQFGFAAEDDVNYPKSIIIPVVTE
jgi:hypothetical protein